MVGGVLTTPQQVADVARRPDNGLRFHELLSGFGLLLFCN